jgi:hypothetical protein
MVNEQPAHDVRRHREEMSAVLPARALLIDESQISLVNQPGRGQRMVGSFAQHVRTRQASEFLVHGIHQGLGGRFLAVTPCQEQARDIGGWACALGRHPGDSTPRGGSR